MGNSLSQILAEIATSYYIKKAISKFKTEEISFLCKNVDDIFTAVDSEIIDNLQDEINSQQTGLKVKIERENQLHEVNYLNLTIGRYHNENNIIHLKWWQKDCSAKHILDYHSFHLIRIKDSVVQEFINSALSITSVQHWQKTIKNIRITLRRSNYPNKFINEKIHNA